MSQRQTSPDLEGEQEVDLASAWQRIKQRWWLPVLGLAAGALVGLALAVSGGEVWRAETIVYLGQPFAPLGGGQIQSLATNPRTVGEIVRSESAIQAASEASGVPASKLRSSISTKELTTVGQARGINPLIEISVKADGPRKAEQALDALTQQVVENVSSYVTDKVELLDEQVAVSESQLEVVQARIDAAQRQQTAVINDASISPTDKLLLIANLNGVIATADARRTALQANVFEAKQLLNQAQNVEVSRVVEPAAAAKTTARSSRTSLLVGGLIGLVLGLVAALVAEPIIARRRAAAVPET